MTNYASYTNRSTAYGNSSYQRNTSAVPSNGGNGGNTQARGASANQISTYITMCKERRITPKPTAGLTYEQLNEMIQQIRNFRPASEKQVQLIKELCERTQTPQPTQEQWERLTAGRAEDGGTAAQLIDNLMRKENLMLERIPPRQSEINACLEMLLNPEVNFRDIDVDVRVSLGEHSFKLLDNNGVHAATKTNIDGLERWIYQYETVELHRNLTVQEIVDQIVKNCTARQVMDFIEKYRGSMAEWRRTRITDRQKDRIRQLERRISNVWRQRRVEQVTNIEGDVYSCIADNKDDLHTYNYESASSDSKQWNPAGYVPLTEDQLMLFTSEFAGRYIDQLTRELNDMESIGVDNRDATHEEIRYARDAYEAKLKDAEAWNNAMYSLCAMAGETDEFMMSSGFYLEPGMKRDYDINDDTRKHVKEFMNSIIEYKFATPAQVMYAIRRCLTLVEILCEDNPFAWGLYESM